MNDATTAPTLESLMASRWAEVEKLYREAKPGPMPDGESFGRATASPGTALGAASRTFFSWFWSGKVFDQASGTLINKTLLGRICRARVYEGPSWLDGKPSLIIDYQGTSWLSGPVRDEIRMVAPGLYLGWAYARPGQKRLLMFVLRFR
jgi:hypothetical protein